MGTRERLDSIDISSLPTSLKYTGDHFGSKNEGFVGGNVMGNTGSGPEGIAVLWRKRLKDALYQLNSATLHLREVQEDYRSRAIPFPDGDLAFRKVLMAEAKARREYMRVATALHEFLMHGKIPSEGDPKAKVKNSESGFGHLLVSTIASQAITTCECFATALA
jgi:hypothetical protein